MSFLDRLSKVVSETVDKGKKELDQLARINRIRGEIRDLEKQISDLRAQIQAAKLQLGAQALEMLRAGTLVSAELEPFVGKVAALEQEIATRQAAIQEKEAAIEAIKAEAVAAAPQPQPQPAATEAPAAQPETRFCPQCGAALVPGAAFCAQCGTRVQ